MSLREGVSDVGVLYRGRIGCRVKSIESQSVVLLNVLDQRLAENTDGECDQVGISWYESILLLLLVEELAQLDQLAVLFGVQVDDRGHGRQVP